MYQYILFDLDGTLTDSAEGITKCVQYSLAAVGINVTDRKELLKFIGPPLAESYQKFYNLDPKTTDFALQKYRERFTNTGLYENKVYAGIPELLEKLRLSGKRLAVATSKPLIFVPRILDYFNLTNYFDVLVGPTLDGKLPTKADVIAETLRQLNISNNLTNNIVMLGDREHDVIGAKLNKIDIIGVTYGYGSTKELSEAGATKLAANTQELATFLLHKSH